MRVILVMLVLLLVFVVIFSVQNPGRVDVDFLNLEMEAPLLIVGLVFFALGVAAGVAGMAPYYLRKRGETRRLKKGAGKTDAKPPEPRPTDPSPEPEKNGTTEPTRTKPR